MLSSKYGHLWLQNKTKKQDGTVHNAKHKGSKPFSSKPMSDVVLVQM